MTPREKVEQAVKDAIREDAGAGLQMALTPRFMRGLVDRVLSATSVVDHEASLASDKPTALASGSGDHAELEVVAWRVKHPRHDAHRLCFVPAATDEAEPLVTAASAEALLAENAALLDREKAALKECSEWARQAGEAIGKLETSEAAGIVEGWRDRATEAERKLAEAEDENNRWAFRFADVREAAGIGVKPMLSEVPGELRKMRSMLDRAADLMRQCTDPERFEGASTLNVYANMRSWLSDLPPAPGAEA